MEALVAVSSGLEKVERLVAQLEDALDIEGKEKDARTILRQALLARLPNPPESGSLADAIEALAEQGDAQQSLEAATLLRCLARDSMVSSTRKGSIERPVVTIVERTLPELANFIGASQKRQTFEKYEVLRTVHGRVEEKLAPFVTLATDLDAIVGARQLLARTLNDPLLKTYCAPSHLAQIRAGFEVVNNKLARLLKDTAGLPTNMTDCKQAIADQMAYCTSHSNFLTKRYFSKYLAIADAALEMFLTSVRGRFKAQIVPRVSEGGALQKRYPFRETGRQIRLAIPLRNLGPGIASNVTVRIETDPERFLLATEELLLGSVAAGDFSAVFNGEVMTEADAVEFLLSVEWDEMGGAGRQQVEVIVTASAQRCDIDWQAQTYRRPYSTDVAKGDTFVGRVDKVQALGNKMLRTPMESFYVTGQKRVGKTSLALAAVAFAKEHSPEPGIESKYLLWGTIANADPAASLRELGTQIAEFMIDSFPAGVQTPALSFDGSIAALTRLADIAAKVRPGLKYVIVIDEFDEIHPELYQHGNLAETFFANIRALTTCDNVCVILVGGENMPFVMDRQGQKLNKFVRVPLDYFSRDAEWEDFQLLVRKPSTDVLEWHEDAIAEVFNVTNGNPFFAKIVCAAVFEDCVRERDSDVTGQEVRSAIAAQVPAFDTNAFAHLWQDGIHKPVNEREPDILRRCRTLVLVARAARRNLPITIENLLAQKHGLMLPDSEIVPVLHNFVGRSVLRENQGQYAFVLPIFRAWLVEVGGSRLIADALGEELAHHVQAAEDEAFVQSSEITALVRNWPTYQGREITSDEVRAWFEQVEGHRQQRLLFKLLQHLRFYGDVEIREALKTLHSFIRPSLPTFVIRKRTDRRSDVLLTYADGEGKSGQFYSSRYAETNGLSAKSIISPYHFSEQVREKMSAGLKPASLLFLDDLVATGRSLAKNLSRFISANEALLRELSIPVIAMAVVVTPEGDEMVREAMSAFNWLHFDLRYVNVVGPRDQAFTGELGIWTNQDEKERAKALCQDLGTLIYPHNPLGFGSQGLLVSFPVNCPNNTLPILHSPSHAEATRSWRPLFPRAVH
ncbi:MULTISPECIES: phosphoribosyltransferase-like protein [Sphingomonadales]|uniref:phosphoribosyltransferase-like protein n=1 Tax=Sphingomonadales TaxID=204457 RepID=UPI00082669CB|nr:MULTISPECIES: ATP-binding protein [Sphingomonadales]